MKQKPEEKTPEEKAIDALNLSRQRYQNYLVGIATAVQTLGGNYTLLGNLLMEADSVGLQKVAKVLEHIKRLLADGRGINYEGVLEDDVEKLLEWATTALGEIQAIYDR